MIRLLKLQFPLLLIVVAVLFYVTGKILSVNGAHQKYYFKETAGVLLIIGACWSMYPILFAKKDSNGNVEIITDHSVEVPADTEMASTKEQN
ncbi:MAG: isoleucyl-tRNA synthetase [Pedobacter sp.]|nr:isoleucyl-tRNA synthetase [Pedobacter sp.]